MNLKLFCNYFALIFTLQSSAQINLVQDFNINGDSKPSNYYLFGNYLFFSSLDSAIGEEPCYTGVNGNLIDVLKDITELDGSLNKKLSSYPSGFSGNSALMFFSADKPNSGRELYVTNLTNQVIQLGEINQGNLSSNPSVITGYGSKFYFSATDHTHGNELWETDGTATGTILFKDINIGNLSSNPQSLTVFSSNLFFSANNGTNGNELYITNGTASGTYLLKDINPGGNSSNPRNFVPFGNKMYFVADDGTHGFELWETDGTASGTKMTIDINPSGNGGPIELFVFNNKLYFRAFTISYGYELYQTDGSPTGTVLLKDIYPGNNSSSPGYFTEYLGLLYFVAQTSIQGKEIWQTDGTAAGTKILKDINTGNNSSDPYAFCVHNNILYFRADDGTNGRELFAFEPTLGINKITFPGANTYSPLGNCYKIIGWGDYIFFTAKYNNNFGHELYKYYVNTTSNSVTPENCPVSLFPNPVQNTLNIELKIPHNIRKINVFNALGQLIQSQIPEKNTVQFDLSKLPNQLFVVQIEYQSDKTPFHILQILKQN